MDSHEAVLEKVRIPRRVILFPRKPYVVVVP
jgi:hypothetical protein